jgi:putative sugar O-methyltransferase
MKADAKLNWLFKNFLFVPICSDKNLLKRYIYIVRFRDKIYLLYLFFVRNGLVNTLLFLKSKNKFEVQQDNMYIYKDTSISDSNLHSTYTTLCGLAASDNNTFRKFRSARAMVQVLDHVTIEQGWEYILEILELAEWNRNFTEIIKKIDEHGKPIKFYFKPYGKFSPTLLRYLKVNLDLIKHFGSLKEYNVTEIGGGFGGQASLINLTNSLSSYSIYDLPPVLDLSKKFIRVNEIPGKFNYYDGRNITKLKSDLVISNYAFSELRRDIQDEYISKVLLNSSRGYITWNPLSWRDLSGYSSEELIRIIPRSQIFQEKPLTYPGNNIIVWHP